MLLQYFLKKENKQKIYSEEIYLKIVDQSKDIVNNNDYFFYKNYKSSFEIISIIIIFYIKSFKEFRIKDYNTINQYIIKNLINDLDNSLRVNGIGDMSIGKYVKSYVKKFYYRLSKLDKILDNLSDDNFTKYLDELAIIKKDNINCVCKDLVKIYKAIQKSL